METIDRSRFLNRLSGGINLNDDRARAALEQHGLSVESLRKFDNGDGRLQGDQELAKVFALVDGFDSNKSPTSFTASGKAGDTYQALLQAAAASGAVAIPAHQLASGQGPLALAKELPKLAMAADPLPRPKGDAELYG